MAVGKLVRGALYVHRGAVQDLATPMRSRLDAALALAPPAAWNVARVEPETVALLEYEDFDAEAFPALLTSTLVNLATGRSARTDYRRSANPLILHRKEQLVTRDDPRVGRWSDITADLVQRGMFKDSHLIGRRGGWLDRLAAHGLKVEGDRVVAE